MKKFFVPLFIVILLSISSSYASAQEGIITTVAGTGTAGYSGDDGPATQAQINYPRGVALDNNGNLYIADAANHRIRKVDPGGIITTIAGTGTRGFGGDGGLAVQAQFNLPTDVALDSSGNLYIVDHNNNRVRKVDTSGTITTAAGTGELGYSGDGGPAIQANLYELGGIALDRYGNLYIAVSDRIRKVDSSGIITTIVGSGRSGYYGGEDGGLAINAHLTDATDVAVDDAGNLYIADSNNNRIRKVDTSGIITTIAGYGASGEGGDGGPATSAPLTHPYAVSIDSTGNIYIAQDRNNRIRKVDTSGIITTIAGGGSGGDGGPAAQSQISTPYGIAIDIAGNLYIAEIGGHRVRKVTFGSGTTPTGTISGSVTNSTIGAGISGATVSTTSGWYLATTDSSGNYTISNVPAGTYTVFASANGYSTASQSNVSISAGGTATVNLSVLQAYITTFAGTGTAGFSGDGGPATQAHITSPGGVAVDSAGNLYIADQNNHRIRKVDTSGIITTVAGTGTSGYSGDGGPATQALLNSAWRIAVDRFGNMYIADQGNNRVRKVDTNGIISTFAGNGGSGWGAEGVPATQSPINAGPAGLLVDNAGNLYFVESGNRRVRKVDTAGIVTTFAGNGDSNSSGDGGIATRAGIPYPSGLALDSTGNIYIAEGIRIRKVDTNGIINTVAGTGTLGFSGDGSQATQAQIGSSQGVAVDSAGNLYIVDLGNQRIRRVDASGIITTVAGTGAAGYSGDGGPATQALINSPSDIAVDSDGNLYIADRVNSRIRKITFGSAALTVGSITGTVTNTSTGAGISGATISTSTGGYSTTSGSNGSYTLSNVTAGTYTVNVSATGYQSGSQANVSVAAGGTTNQNFSLTPLLALATLSSIAITPYLYNHDFSRRDAAACGDGDIFGQHDARCYISSCMDIFEHSGCDCQLIRPCDGRSQWSGDNYCFFFWLNSHIDCYGEYSGFGAAHNYAASGPGGFNFGFAIEPDNDQRGSNSAASGHCYNIKRRDTGRNCGRYLDIL